MGGVIFQFRYVYLQKIKSQFTIKMSKITLQCVKEKSKLRIKFFSFTDDEGKVYTNVYNNDLNCKFPKDIRQDGYFYEIGPNDIVLVSRPNTQAFYQIKTTNMKIVPKLDMSSIRIYEITECVICMDQNSTEILVPCGHLCMCKSCCESLLKSRSNCPICRREVLSVVS